MSKKRTPAKATAATKAGAAFGIDEQEPSAPDAKTFDLRSWMAGTALTTRSIDVCGKPHLMGRIQELAAKLERPEAHVVDERAAGMSQNEIDAHAVAEELEALREEMLESIVTWKMRGLSSAEIAEIKESTPESPDGVAGERDYSIWAAQVVSINGQPIELEWTDLQTLHRGAKGVAGLGEYFLQTIAATANAAHLGVGVTVPFSQRSSSLTSPPPKS
ncbi:hypothetical protein [Knoellia sp. LjRoot47]|uniref:hypothetical protein n=1 Tax=Knoellia sp. LjRoot47 TaxID=3342330 RepID=UPI003ECCB87A